MSRVVPLLLLLLMPACSRPAPANAGAEAVPTTTGATAPAGATPVTAAKPVPAQLPDVVARVNGEAISKAEFESAVATVESNAGGPVPAAERDQVYRQVLDQMVSYRLLVQETRARKLAAANADIDTSIAKFRSQFPSEEAFTQTLERQKMTIERLRANALNDILVSKLLEAEMAGKVAVTPQQVDEFYKNNPDQFQQAERVRASHILFGFPQGADDAARQLARTRAATVLKDVQSGKDFAELARLHSADSGSAPNGGDLGYFQQGQMVAEFDKVAFSLKPGQTSSLVETEFGVHIIRVADHQAARTLPLDEIRPRLQQFIEQQKRQEHTQAFIETLKAKSKVEIYI